ncbi:MAG: IS110 family transposase [Geminicoccaceae bacterium]
MSENRFLRAALRYAAHGIAVVPTVKGMKIPHSDDNDKRKELIDPESIRYWWEANALRGHLSEFGIVVTKGIQNVQKLVAIVGDYSDNCLPDVAREVLTTVIDQLRDTTRKIDDLEKRIYGWHQSNEVSRRLATAPGIGPMTATALVATVGDPRHFKSGRQFAAWLGITPREDSTGGKARPGKISKRGDGYLRCLLIHGARSVVQAHRRKATEASSSSWLGQLLARRHVNVATVAMANRNARIAWALMVHGTTYQPRA